MLHYSFHGFLRTVLLVQKAFQNYFFHLRAAMKTQRLANISKVALAASDYAVVQL